MLYGSFLKTNHTAIVSYKANEELQKNIIFTQNYENSIKIANRKHDLIAFRLYDKAEDVLPNIGLVPMLDAETNTVQWVNTSRRRFKEEQENHFLLQGQRIESLCRRVGASFLPLYAEDDFVDVLAKFLKYRNRFRS